MLGVTPLIKNMERLLMERKINTGTIGSRSPSLLRSLFLETKSLPLSVEIGNAQSLIPRYSLLQNVDGTDKWNGPAWNR